MKRILIITTGGTIDAQTYAVTPEYVTPLEHSAVPEVVAALGLADRCDFLHLFRKDSKEITGADLEKIADTIRDTYHMCIILTHGTDRIPENSRALAALLEGTEKTIVFTGAMVPLSHGEGSDGAGNLAYAINNIETFGSGVHAVMHGMKFEIATLRKDFTNKRFYNEEGRGGG